MIQIVQVPEIKAAVIRIPRNGHEVRRAWRRVETLLEEHSAVACREYGHVFVPEWQWATEVNTLWVGMEVTSLEDLPEELELLTLPARRYAKLTVKGDRSRMTEAYGQLERWFTDGPHKRDYREGSFSYEANRLQPVNPFHVDADQIDWFDYDIYAPIRDEPAH